MKPLPGIIFNLILYTTILACTKAQTSCPPGSFRDGSSCQQCPIATWQNRNNANSCRNCPSGQTTVGTGSQGRDLCIPCPVGTYLAADNSCTSCPSGTTTRPGATSRSQCLRCGPGTFLNNRGTACVRCARGTFSSGEMNDACEICPVGTSPRGATSAAACAPSSCPPGSVDDGTGTCRRCQPISFQSGGRCLSCPAGTVSRGAATECTPCPTNTFGEALEEFCTPCPSGSVALGTGSTVCRRRNGPCPIDSVEVSNGACVRCPFDQRVNVRTGLCEMCPENTRAEAADGTVCTRCPRGMVVTSGVCACRPGTQMMNGRCRPCRRGTASSGLGECEVCDVGLVAPQNGMSECVACPRDMVPTPNRRRCVRCPSGTSTGIGPELLLIDVVLLDIDGCRNQQSGCPAGFERFDEFGSVDCIPEICRRNTPAGANCRRCEPGFSPTTSTFAGNTFLCDSCSSGVSDGITCRDCPRGLTADSEDASRCFCGAGRGLETGACRRCPLGTYSDFDDELCVACGPGSFSGRVGSDTCEVCPVDTFTNSSGQSRCEACPPGSFNYGEGESECLEFLS